MRKRPVVTIDGPSGAGKTTVSKRLAERAGMVRLDTGAMYRACALAARRAGIPWSDAARLGKLAREMELSFRDAGGAPGVFLSGEDVSGAIRTPEMSLGASEVSGHLPVREALVA
jgi:cytidylate kinase